MKKLIVILVAFIMGVIAMPVNASADERIEINGFGALKAHLDYKGVKKSPNSTETVDRFVLEPGNYHITDDFAIDLDDPFFVGKEEAIANGIIYTTENFTLDGGGHTISFTQDDAVALFGMVNSPDFIIENLKISYPGNVSGFTFARSIRAEDKEGNDKIAKADGMVRDIEITVGGNVTPLDVDTIFSNHFIGGYKGYISSGFAWSLLHTHLENIAIDIKGDIGNEERPEKDSDMVAAYGLTHHYGPVPSTKWYNAESWHQLHDVGNSAILKEAGHILGLQITVGGSIKAYGNNAGYSAGIGQDMATAWMEKVDVKVAGDIVTDLIGNGASMGSHTDPYAFGFSEELMTLTDSTLEVENIIFRAENLPRSSMVNLVGAVANNNSKGNHINLKHNTVQVKGQIQGHSNQNIKAFIGFNNDWNSLGSDGTNWLQESENNSHTVGSIDLKSDERIYFYALGDKWRTGQKPLGELTLPEASLKNNTVQVGDISIVSPKLVQVALLMNNSANAKNNTLEYGNIKIKADDTRFYGMGNLRNQKPAANFHENIAENNHITMGDVNIDTNKAPYISLMVGLQEKDQKLKHCTVKAGKVDIKLNSEKFSYIGGIASYAKDAIDSCRVFVDDVRLINESKGGLCFGLGTGYAKGATIENSGVFVDANIDIQANNVYGGGFVGSAETGSVFQNNDFQVDGAFRVSGEGIFGGFAGEFVESKMTESTSLILNDAIPFAGFVKNAEIDRISHYVNGEIPQDQSGLIDYGTEEPKITNATLLVEKPYDNTILYRKVQVSPESGNNYLVVVDNDDTYNRVAYTVAERTFANAITGENETVYQRAGDPIGKININKRPFQDKYWHKNVLTAPYVIGDAERDFAYMTRKDGNVGNISAIGLDSGSIVSDSGQKGHLFDYHHRHAGLRSDSGIVYDLLGIKGSKGLTVTYDGNGADGGSVPIDETRYQEGDKVTVLAHGDLARTGYEFIGWNTKADGSGKMYQAGNTFDIIADTTLYAQWKKKEKPDNHCCGEEDGQFELNREDHFQYLIGYEDMTFHPDSEMSRQEVTVMFSRLLRERPERGKIYGRDYYDVKDNLWSVTGISYMSMLGIVKGYPDGSFRPLGDITRAEFAAIASRFDKLDMGNATFSDVSPDHWAYEDICKAAAAGWISGYPDGSFKPEQPITRAEVVSIVNRMLNRYADPYYVERNPDKIINYRDIEGHWAYYPIIEATNGHDFERKANGKDELWLEVNDKTFI